MTKCIHFNDIDITNRETWDKKAIISFDMDWAPDFVLEELISIFKKTSIKATFFVTHHTDILNELRKDPAIELGVHPNFNRCIGYDSDPNEVLRDMLAIVPNAQVLRSHSLTTSGRWIGMYASAGIHYLSNTMMNNVAIIEPYMQINRLVEVPIFFADDGWLFINELEDQSHQVDLQTMQQFEGVRVFNFHPVHIFLNSPNLAFYNEHKSELASSKPYEGFGVRHIFESLLEHLS